MEGRRKMTPVMVGNVQFKRRELRKFQTQQDASDASIATSKRKEKRYHTAVFISSSDRKFRD